MMNLKRFVVLTLPFVLCGCFDLFPCETEEFMRVTSPDGQHDLVAFRANCGATTRESYHASLLPSGQAVAKGGGNVFAAELERGPIAHVLVGWSGDTAQVFYNAPREVFRQEPTAQGYPIEYVVGDGIDIIDGTEQTP